jgi:Glyoxalase-like domain
MKPFHSVLDHLVYVTPDLDATIDEVERRLGVRAAIGGQHPKWRTKNALLSLGPRTYLEIMGPDRNQPESQQPRPFGIDAIVKPRLATWVARTDDVQSVIAKARRHTLDLGEPQAGSRQRPDGSTLKWIMTDLTKDREGGIIPYFIDWGDSSHPAESSPKGCSLIGLEGFHPDADRVKEILKGLELEFPVQRGSIALKATIESPKGKIVLE